MTGLMLTPTHHTFFAVREGNDNNEQREEANTIWPKGRHIRSSKDEIVLAISYLEIYSSSLCSLLSEVPSSFTYHHLFWNHSQVTLLPHRKDASFPTRPYRSTEMSALSVRSCGKRCQLPSVALSQLELSFEVLLRERRKGAVISIPGIQNEWA